MNSRLGVLIIMLLGAVQVSAGRSGDNLLPVNPPDAESGQKGIRNLLTFQQIRNVTGVAKDGSGLLLDLEDGSLFGTIYSGQ